ncbi:MAG: FUSC family protein, partial [Eubacterium sp.]|nr:FUSC family protein [Eubacterium sp.]
LAMSFYQELQLDAVGFKSLIKESKNKKEKASHIAIFIFKVLLNTLFCILLVTAFSAVFKDENRMVGVIITISILQFRLVDLQLKKSHAVLSLAIVFIILMFGPHLANLVQNLMLLPGNLSALAALPIHLVCIFGIVIFGCHNINLYNQFVFVLGYLLLYGYDVTGKLYILRVACIGVGALIVISIYCIKQRKRTCERTLKNIFKEFNIRSVRTSWQIKITLAVATILVFTKLIGAERGMWAGIATMSVIVPNLNDIPKRSINRCMGNIAGSVLFALMYTVFPDYIKSFIGVIGGIGNGFCSQYRWQAMFNSLGAMAMGVTFFGAMDVSIWSRLFNNVIGAVYGILFGLLFHRIAALIIKKNSIKNVIN